MFIEIIMLVTVGEKASGMIETFYTLNCVIVIQVYTFIKKNHQVVSLRLMQRMLINYTQFLKNQIGIVTVKYT